MAWTAAEADHVASVSSAFFQEVSKGWTGAEGAKVLFFIFGLHVLRTRREMFFFLFVFFLMLLVIIFGFLLDAVHILHTFS